MHLSDQDLVAVEPIAAAAAADEPTAIPTTDVDALDQEADLPNLNIEEQPSSDGGAAAGGHKKRKRVTKMTVLDEAVERDLGDWLANEASFIYDKKDPRHTNKDMVSVTWASKAQSLTPALTMEELKKWWDSIRTRFGKLSAGGKSGQGAIQLTDREKWILNTFSFLRPHIVRQRKTRTCGLQTSVVS